jgi:hypothetical protein
MINFALSGQSWCLPRVQSQWEQLPRDATRQLSIIKIKEVVKMNNTALENKQLVLIDTGRAAPTDAIVNSLPVTGVSTPLAPANGSLFYCRGHLAYLPIKERSPRNPDYCRACFGIIEAESRRDKDPDRWEGEVFIHHNKRYCPKAFIPKGDEPYATEIKTVCLGPVNTPVSAKNLTTPLKDTVTVPPVTQSTAASVKNVSVTTDNCLFCGKELTKHRKSKLFCDAFCRVRYSRTKAAKQ